VPNDIITATPETRWEWAVARVGPLRLLSKESISGAAVGALTAAFTSVLTSTPAATVPWKLPALAGIAAAVATVLLVHYAEIISLYIREPRIKAEERLENMRLKYEAEQEINKLRQREQKALDAKPALKTFALTADPSAPPHYGVNRQLCLRSGDGRDVEGVRVSLKSLIPPVNSVLPGVLLRAAGVTGAHDDKTFKLLGAVPKMVGVFGTFPGRPESFLLYTLADDLAGAIPSLPSSRRYVAELIVTGDDAEALNSVAEFGVDENGVPVISVRNN
jgi:hypothetical protein